MLASKYQSSSHYSCSIRRHCCVCCMTVPPRAPVPCARIPPRFIMLPGFQLALPGFRPPPPGFRYRCQDFGFISCWNSESPKQTVQNVCQPAARISALLPGFHYANSSWNSEGPRSGWNSESPNSSWNSVRPNSSWNWDFSEGGAECMHSEYVR